MLECHHTCYICLVKPFRQFMKKLDVCVNVCADSQGKLALVNWLKEPERFKTKSRSWLAGLYRKPISYECLACMCICATLAQLVSIEVKGVRSAGTEVRMCLSQHVSVRIELPVFCENSKRSELQSLCSSLRLENMTGWTVVLLLAWLLRCISWPLVSVRCFTLLTDLLWVELCAWPLRMLHVLTGT